MDNFIKQLLLSILLWIKKMKYLDFFDNDSLAIL